MRIVPLLVALVIAGSVVAQDAPAKKRGGFTGATPKPATKKSGSTGTATKKKTTSSSDDQPTDEKKQVSKKKPSADDDEQKPATASATPAPKKRKTQAAEDSTVGEKKEGAAADAPKKSTQSSDAEASVTPVEKREHAPAATVSPEEISEFAAQPPKVQALITAALELTKLNLTYTYGSADPAQGGMDCSGAMYHLLREQGFKDVPRDSSSQYVWARKAGPFFAVVSKSAESFEFKDLQPGDLLFWTGTYETGREIPISHVMLYLGTEKKTKKRIMFGSSDGRSYNGVQRWGVSVFDFKMPKADAANPERAKVDFVGYGRIPSLRESTSAVVAESEVADDVTKPTAEQSVTKSGTSTKKRTKTRAPTGS